MISSSATFHYSAGTTSASKFSTCLPVSPDIRTYPPWDLKVESTLDCPCCWSGTSWERVSTTPESRRYKRERPVVWRSPRTSRIQMTCCLQVNEVMKSFFYFPLLLFFYFCNNCRYLAFGNFRIEILNRYKSEVVNELYNFTQKDHCKMRFSPWFSRYLPLIGDPQELCLAADIVSLIVLWLLLGLLLDMELSVLSLLDCVRAHTATLEWKGCSISPSEDSSDDSPVNGMERIWLARPGKLRKWVSLKEYTGLLELSYRYIPIWFVFSLIKGSIGVPKNYIISLEPSQLFILIMLS